MLPSTLISISGLDARVPLKVTFEPTLDYPFAGPLSFSIEGGLPEVKFKVLPVSESSGLKGVDLNSMPLLSTWIKDGLDSVLEEFVDPGFVRFDLERYLKLSTWVACGGMVGAVGGRGEVVGLERIPDVEAARMLTDADPGGGDRAGAKGRDASGDLGGHADGKEKGLIVIEGGAQEQPGSNILLGNGGLKEVRECEEQKSRA